MLETDIRLCKDYEELHTEEAWPFTQWMYFRTMSVDVGELLTDKACKLFHERNQQLAIIYDNEFAASVTLEDIKRYTGLKVNVTTTTAGKWNSRLLWSIKERGKRAAERKLVRED